MKNFLEKNLAYCISILLLAMLSFFIRPFMLLASFSYFCLCCGLLKRKERKTHAKLMSIGIFTDISLILILEAQRSAINTAVEFSLNPLQQAHIIFSTIATLLYFPTLYLGYQRCTQKSITKSSRLWHIRLGLTAFIARSIGFLLMFSMLSLYKS